jgi:hypothetical protein
MSNIGLGASAGMVAGSIIPGVGNIAGGIIGGLGGVGATIFQNVRRNRAYRDAARTGVGNTITDEQGRTLVVRSDGSTFRPILGRSDINLVHGSMVGHLANGGEIKNWDVGQRLSQSGGTNAAMQRIRAGVGVEQMIQARNQALARNGLPVPEAPPEAPPGPPGTFDARAVADALRNGTHQYVGLTGQARWDALDARYGAGAGQASRFNQDGSLINPGAVVTPLATDT